MKPQIMMILITNILRISDGNTLKGICTNFNFQNYTMEIIQSLNCFLNFPDLKKDDLVILRNDEQFVKSEFNQSNFDWDDKMKLMLGETFPILEKKGQLF